MKRHNYFTVRFFSHLRAPIRVASLLVVCFVCISIARADAVFTAVLNGSQVVPSTNSAASGVGSVILNDSETMITVTINLNGLPNAQFASRIHGAAPRGANADKILSLPPGVFTQNYQINASQAADLKAGLWYFNISTQDFPGGEIRGQIEPLCAPANSGGAGVCTDAATFSPVRNGKIIFERGIGNPNPQIFTIDENGGNLIKLTLDSHTAYFSPAYSPDNTKIAFSSSGRLYTMNSDGTNQAPLLAVHSKEETFPRWSPDGGKIVFTLGSNDDAEIYTINSDGSNLKRLTDNSFYEYNGTWSPDGSRILFVRRIGAKYNIYAMKPDGSEVTPLTDGNDLEFDPSWSPDGKKILFSRYGDIYVMKADGTNIVNLTNTPFINENQPAWSPDGKKIVYVHANSDNLRELWMMNSDGSGQTAFLGGVYNGNPMWQSLPNNQNVEVSPANGVKVVFANVLSPGATAATQLNANGLPKLPPGYFAVSPTYDVRTSVAYAGLVTVSVSVNSIADNADCTQLRLLHFTEGAWTETDNQTPVFNAGTCTVSQLVSTLSPFVVARYSSSAQTAAVSGNIIYGATPAGQPAKSVANVWLTAAGTTYSSVSGNSNGSYLLDGLLANGQYTVTPSKTGEVNGITPFDAVLVLRCAAAGANCALNNNQRLAADTNNSGTLTPFDAVQILRYAAAGRATSGTGAVGAWKFSPAARNYALFGDSLAGQNYTAILVGEVNGSWTPSASGAAVAE